MLEGEYRARYGEILSFWWHLAPTWNGHTMIADDRAPIAVATDDSGVGDIGAVCDELTLSELAPKSIIKEGIMALEIYAVVRAFRLWGVRWRGQRVMVYCDNQAVIAAIKSGSIKDAAVMRLLRE
ncbi:uncharacterized protein L969DRAFT_20514 [Mixia osmundae IAM 14324]|uniref:uncharacterized protein n=1 Tax=Mixia osmundae (strain CBS 9802 / IAM 14324 / JCM 22182 / KY 12970) TaxID=764103 RepID=UPI0004A54FA5|nr:uncharacterized protein L969DRAFT_20606 [Mixia osmundae IAM 14324]XP_014564785.1 uncharacterized protein L969DRAFT_20514 [Mixia osmundae IAM 14324]KEI36128.1 hypothetical protein L969DRAFT_20606 [Mixia osmundae IAM 14324]KEI36304.1 hypothetical protein L969DRAFT_20514 [Mixia osmundae IAM 14324]